MSKSISLRFALTSMLLAAATASQAHTGHGAHGLAEGLAHPFLGLDHLLAMVAVGLWSAIALPVGRRLLGPGVFLATLLIGALLSWEGVTLPAVESSVAASVVLLGAMLFAGRRVPTSLGLTLVSAAALFHGYAHGSELATTLLHGVGLAAGVGLQRLPDRVARLAAAVVGGAGVVMLAARL